MVNEPNGVVDLTSLPKGDAGAVGTRIRGEQQPPRSPTVTSATAFERAPLRMPSPTSTSSTTSDSSSSSNSSSNNMGDDGLCPDIVDLSDEAIYAQEIYEKEIMGATTTVLQSEQTTQTNKRSQTHPKKLLMEAKRRKLEREVQAEQRRRQEVAAEATARSMASTSPNFVVIDDSSSDSDSPYGRPSPPTTKTSDLKGETKNAVTETSETMINNTSEEGGSENGSKRRRRKKSGRPRKVSTGQKDANNNSNGDDLKFRNDRDYNYQISQEAALEMQEKLFRDAAARLRQQQAPAQHSHHQNFTQVDSNGVHDGLATGAPPFENPVFDVATQFPSHWTWKDPYACLGLPPNASLSLVKSQYRRLAKLYHPDKSQLPNTGSKFHGIALAYRKLTKTVACEL